MHPNKLNILITGCAGFIGSHLCEKLLSLGFVVTGIDNFDPYYSPEIKQRNMEQFIHHPHFTFIKADLSKSDFYYLLNDQPLDMVIHLAGKAGVRSSHLEPEAYVRSNVTATQNVLEFMKYKQIKKLLFASSSTVYGNNPSPFSESQETNKPISPYAYTKRSCELMNYTYHQLFDIDVLNLRFFSVFGPRQRPDLVIHHFSRQILNDQSIPVFGNGNSARDYTYIDDLINGISQAVTYLWDNHKIYDTINLGNNSPVTLKQLIEELESVLQKKAILQHLPQQAGEVGTSWADISKAQRLLNYSPSVSLRDGLIKFREWFEKKQRKVGEFG
jgi:UDP-glucuronate 4-epimerase